MEYTALYFPPGLCITDTAYAVPKTVMHSDAIDIRLGTQLGVTERKTGIRRRHMAPGIPNSAIDLAYAAVCCLDQGPINMLVVGTFTAPQHLPSLAAKLSSRIKLPPSVIAPFDVNSGCVSGLEALVSVCARLPLMREQSAGIAVGVDVASHAIDWTDVTGVAPLLGDAAAAVRVVCRQERASGLVPILSLSGNAVALSNAITLNSSFASGNTVNHIVDPFIRMAGRAVYRWAIEHVPEIVLQTLLACGQSLATLDMLIMHHANGRIITDVQKKLGLSDDRIYSCIETLGNTSSAATLVPLAHAWQHNRIEKGMTVMLVSFGAGMAISSLLCRMN